MDYQSLNSKTMAELRQLAKESNVRLPRNATKAVVIDLVLKAEKNESAVQIQLKEVEPTPTQSTKTEKNAKAEKNNRTEKTAKPKKTDKPEKTAKTEKTEKADRPEKTVKSESAVQPEKIEEKKPETEPERDMTIDRRVHPAVRPVRPLTQHPISSAQPVRPYHSRQVIRTKLNAQSHFQPTTVDQSEVRRDAVEPRRTSQTLSRRVDNENRRPNENYIRREYGENRRVVEETPRREYGENRRVAEETPRREYGENRRVVEETPRREYGENRRVAEETPRRNFAEPIRRSCEETSEVLRPRTETNDAMPVGDFADGAGLLEIQPDGYGFLRAENCLPGSNDIYISNAQIRRFNLRMGDYVVGKTRPQREGDRYGALMYITQINGEPPEKAALRKPFESLIPWYPTQRLRLENPKKPDYSLRLIDMLAPIGKGQRGLIVSQPKAGKTTLLKKVANAIADSAPEVKLIVLLIDERPEEVTDMKRSIHGDVIYSTFDEAPENHTRVAEMVLEHAQRMVEMGKDVVILLDSITRLARAYNQSITPTGRSMSGGLDPGALNKPKRFFGAARNIENGGSLTIIATALVDTGSRMDDIIYEEFKGTGNMELHLDRKLSDRRIFPAIDMVRSGTRREDLLLTPEELEGSMQVRRMLSGGNTQESTEQLIGLMEKSATNAELFQKMKAYAKVYEKDGFSMSGR